MILTIVRVACNGCGLGDRHDGRFFISEKDKAKAIEEIWKIRLKNGWKKKDDAHFCPGCGARRKTKRGAK